MFTNISAESTGLGCPSVIFTNEVKHNLSHEEIVNYIINDFRGWELIFNESTTGTLHVRDNPDEDHKDYPMSLTDLKFSKKNVICDVTLRSSEKSLMNLRYTSGLLQLALEIFDDSSSECEEGDN